MSRFSRLVSLFFLVWGLVGCDHVSKHLAQTKLVDGTVYPVAGSAFDLRYTENRDVAFNLLRFVPESSRTPLIFGCGAFALLALGAWFYVRRAAKLPEILALSLVLAGALGNFIDRAMRGYVVDFMHVPHWPVFNVADVYLTVGGLVLLVLSRTRAHAGRAQH